MTGPSLTAPFKHSRTMNKGGTTLTYIAASDVIDRLNACLGTGWWSYEVLESFLFPESDPIFAVAKGRLTVEMGDGPAIYEQFGGQSINKKRDGSIIDLADDLKGAASDAMKKCAQMIGVGLYLALEHPPVSAQDESRIPEKEGGAESQTDKAGIETDTDLSLEPGTAGDASTNTAQPSPATPDDSALGPQERYAALPRGAQARIRGLWRDAPGLKETKPGEFGNLTDAQLMAVNDLMGQVVVA